ncbi:hypothetical protein GCM10007423_17640 [Dyadobacter endophyticus]|uniref:Uncharacterized protein n=1 Tax=Dyadobacter endophyticus TaxID=1749036 RepID=A0ABQ1YMG2_9BACT|nr:hypothetical protein GCM10007423_17640 [Dyadobacter endophyticus]
MSADGRYVVSDLDILATKVGNNLHISPAGAEMAEERRYNKESEAGNNNLAFILPCRLFIGLRVISFHLKFL